MFLELRYVFHFAPPSNQFKKLKSLLFASTLIGCGQKDLLTPLREVNIESTVNNSVTVNFCTDPAYNQKQYLKTIIILDHSSSNQNNYKMMNDGSGNAATPFVQGPQYATDPDGILRYGNIATAGTLLNHLSTLPANDPLDPNRYFALIDFATGVQTYPAGSVGFTSDIPDFYNHVQNDATIASGRPNDVGYTDYMKALTEAYNIINNDIQAASTCASLPATAIPTLSCPRPGVEVASSYVIIFMSDGAPVINTSFDANGNLLMTKEPASDILALVSTIASLTSNTRFVTSVNLFSIYYYLPGNVDNTAQVLLENMARMGNGISYGALSGSKIDYTQFQPPAKRIRFFLSDVFVTNTSVTWWTDGKLHADTDMDGLPDEVEITWGSDYRNPISDGNGVSDLVKYYVTNGAPCLSKNAAGRCIDPITNYRGTLCSGVSFSGGRFASSDPGGLNDCEKRILDDIAGVNNPDSNGDMIPDWLEFTHNVPFQVGTAPAVNSPNQDGFSIYQKIKYALPMNISAPQLLNLTPAVYSLVLTRSTADQDCYALQVSGLPVVGGGNTIRVDVLLKSPLLQNRIFYRVGKKSIPSGGQSVQFNDWTNPAEIAANTWSLWQ